MMIPASRSVQEEDDGQISARAASSRRRYMPGEYYPSAYDVMCGRGKTAANHIGNQRFKVTISIYLRRYSESTSRAQKTAVISDVVELVRQNSPGGGFVKYDQNKSKWYEVGDHLAREKVSQAFRDMLHDRYESSNFTKQRKRRAARSDSHKQNDEAFVEGLPVKRAHVQLTPSGSVVTEEMAHEDHELT